jgi:RNA polymerase sigma-70 factor (ECF subfamily)
LVLRAIWRPFVLTDPDRAEAEPSVDERVRGLVRAHYKDVWRVLRHLGLPLTVVEDAAQQVFLVATAKLARIEPGKERAFLVGTAIRVAANHRHSSAARHESPDEDMDAHADDAPGADELLDQKRLRDVLETVLSALPADLRTVLVLFELEGFEVPEIAAIVGIPVGTAASRLRRAREAFELKASRVRARHAFPKET